MPYDDPDSTDPMTLHGVVVDVDGVEAQREMAACFIEEFIRMGFGRERLLALFRTRGYAGPHLAYRVLGEETVTALVDGILRRWGPRTPAQTPDRAPDGSVRLPVLG